MKTSPVEAMAYSYNRTAFRSATTGSLPLLVRAYAMLVTLELSLKEVLPARGLNCPRNHDVPEMLRRLSGTLPGPHKANLRSLALSLRSTISYLWCEDGSGNPCHVPAAGYPNMRYLRHVQDWPASASSDADVSALVTLSSQIAHAIGRSTGVTP